MDTNPYLLAMTVVITLVHNVFEFLAFKNGTFCGTINFEISFLSLLFNEQ